MSLSDAALERLRDRQPVLADVVDVDRRLAAQRRAGVISLELVQLRRDCVRAAEATWGHQLRGNGDRLA